MSQEPKGQSNGFAPPSSGRPAGPNAVSGKAGGAGATSDHNKHDELRLLVNSRHPLITVERPEEERFEELLLEVATELSVPMYEWSVAARLAKYRGAPIYNTDQPEQALANIPLIPGDAIFLRAGHLGFPAPFLLTSVIAIVILTKLMYFVVLAKVAIVAIFPNVATAGIEERVVTPTI